MTPAQQREYLLVIREGFVIFPPRTPRGLTRYKPLWALVEMGLIDFGFGPKGSWLQTYGFYPLWTDPVC